MFEVGCCHHVFQFIVPPKRFNTMVSQLMSEDIKRTDTLDENLIHLEKEIDEVEKDVSLLGIMLGKVVEEKERRALERSGHGGSSDDEGKGKNETAGVSGSGGKPEGGDAGKSTTGISGGASDGSERW